MTREIHMMKLSCTHFGTHKSSSKRENSNNYVENYTSFIGKMAHYYFCFNLSLIESYLEYQYTPV